MGTLSAAMQEMREGVPRPEAGALPARACTTCRWSHTPTEDAGAIRITLLPRCLSPRVNRRNPDWLANPHDGWYCATARMFGWFSARLIGTCGYEGRFWEPRPPEAARIPTPLEASHARA